MPNASGPHSSTNAKSKQCPANVGYQDVIGYTGNPNDSQRPVTVYTKFGHFTQVHRNKWNEGWDSYVGWTCLFFGNVPKDDEIHGRTSSHEDVVQPNGRIVRTSIAPSAYVKQLEGLGRNRFVGGQWKLQRWGDETHDHILREFWIRGAGLNERDRFAHPSRAFFTPVESDRAKRMLWDQIKFS